jgi:uncharacterized protein (TIGR03067 family)
MRRVVLSVLLLSASVAMSAPAPFAKTVRRGESNGDLARLQGTWENDTTYIREQDGWRVIHGGRGEYCVVICGSRAEWLDSLFPPVVGTVSLREGSPRRIDFASTSSNRVWQCVYRLDGDTLTIVYPLQGEQRPTSLERGDTKVVYRRKR